MSDYRKFILAGIWVIILLLLLALKAPETSFSSSVVDLLPGDQLEVRVLRELAEKEQGRLLNVRLYAGDAAVQPDTVTAFLNQLEQSPAIEEAWIAGSDSLRESGEFIFRKRYEWLLPFWLDENFPDWRIEGSTTLEEVSNRVVENLDDFLSAPDGFALSETIPRDPFLLLSRLSEQEGLAPTDSSEGEILLWVDQAASPFLEAGQEPVFEALANALEFARGNQIGLEIEYSGVSVLAHASKASIKKEIQRLNLIGLGFVLLVALLAIRQLFILVRISIVLSLSLLTAAVTVIAVFPSVHVIALVIGSILAGIAVDYAFHLFLSERHGLGKRDVTRAVISGSVSSSFGFIMLLWAPLPFLQQVGVFVGAGLVTALCLSLLLRPGASGVILSARWQFQPFSLYRWLGPAILLMVVPGWFFLEWKDSINDLEYPLPELKQTEERLRHETEVGMGYQAYVVTGETLPKARENLDGVLTGISPNEVLHAGKWIPLFEDSVQAQRLFSGFPDFKDALSGQLEEHDFVSEAFAGFFEDWDLYLKEPISRESYVSDVGGIALSLPGPLRTFVHPGEDPAWFMLLAPASLPLGMRSEVIRLDQAQILSRSFAHYRDIIAGFGSLCLLGILSGMWLVYGIKWGSICFSLPFAGTLFAFGLVGYLHPELSVFHLIGAMLAFCIGLDYSIFGIQSSRKGCPVPSSVTVSLVTTLGVFAILSSSQIPAVRQLALTVLTAISATFIFILVGWPFVRNLNQRGRVYAKRLPHGPDALFIGNLRDLNERTVEIECSPNTHQNVPGDCLVEAMAQAAAVWLASTDSKEEVERMGMLVVVQNCELCQPVLFAGIRYNARVESLSDGREGLLMFKGVCSDEEGKVAVKASFSIFIPPLETIQESKGKSD